MFKEGSYVETIGLFRVIGLQDDYVELDPYEKGHEQAFTEFEEKGFEEVDDAGNAKNFDGFEIGDFFHFDGRFEVVRSNELYTKVRVYDHLISLPNHKLLEVE